MPNLLADHYKTLYPDVPLTMIRRVYAERGGVEAAIAVALNDLEVTEAALRKLRAHSNADPAAAAASGQPHSERQGKQRPKTHPKPELKLKPKTET